MKMGTANDDQLQMDQQGNLLVCLCDLDESDVVYDRHLGQYELCNEHKAAKLASLAEMGLQCAVWLGRIDQNGDFQREPIKQVKPDSTQP